MKAKKSSSKRSARSATRPKKALARRAPPKRAAAKKAVGTRRAPPRKLAAFSSKILHEEEAPVAVRSWGEAKVGSSGSQQFTPATGQVTALPGARAVAPPATEPRLDPLAGPMSVSKARHEEFEFSEQPKPKRGKKAERPEEFGQVELRQATASGGRHLTRAKPENLQRGASRIKPLAAAEASSKRRSNGDKFSLPPAQKHEDDRGGSTTMPTDLLDFGDVEIAQQTRSGSRAVGTLDPDAKKRRRDDSAQS